MTTSNATYLAVDWGSTNFRLFGIDADNNVVLESHAPLGVFQIGQRNFAEVLAEHLTTLGPDAMTLPIVMAGMIGSRSGWFDVPYVAAPSNIHTLSKSAYHFDLPWGPDAYIIPGMSFIDDTMRRDVMRGEEVQLFGLLAHTSKHYDVAILPGTHSKHVTFCGKRISSFTTYFTGEMYHLLSEHSSVRPPTLASTRFHQDAFMLGVKRAQEGSLLSDVFSARTAQLFADLPDEHIADFLSGILIGHELAHVPKNAQIAFIGGEKLCHRYRVAALSLSLQSDIHSGDQCFLEGMSSLLKEMNFDTNTYTTN